MYTNSTCSPLKVGIIFNSLRLIGINWKIGQNLKIKLKKAGFVSLHFVAEWQKKLRKVIKILDFI